MEGKNSIIIYNTTDGKAAVSLFARDGSVWMNQNQLAELFDTSKQNVGQHISNILKEKELDAGSVVKNYFTTASDGKQYEVAFYSLDMILAIGFRVRSQRGTQFRKWANHNLRHLHQPPPNRSRSGPGRLPILTHARSTSPDRATEARIPSSTTFYSATLTLPAWPFTARFGDIAWIP
jgi:hypothetical protein